MTITPERRAELRAELEAEKDDSWTDNCPGSCMSINEALGLLEVLDTIEAGHPKSLRDVLVERARQDEKWGEQNHDNPTWALIAGEEFGEVQQAILHDRFGGRAAGTTRDELVQLVAVGLQWLECMDRNGPEVSP